MAIEEENMAIDSKELDELYKKWDEEGRQDVKVEGNTKKQAIESITVESCLELTPHEKITTNGLLTVAKGILKDLKFTWPVFVDEDSRVVLDGMHRFKLLEECCFKRIPVQLIEYNDDIKLYTWCRHIKGIKKEEFLHCVEEFNLEEANIELKEVEKRESAIIFSPEDKSYKFSGDILPKDEYFRLEGLEESLRKLSKKKDAKIDHDCEKKIKEKKQEKNSVAIFPMALSKKDVKACKNKDENEVFPPKTTRHIFQYRVYNIDVSLKTLKSDEDPGKLTSQIWEKNMTRDLYYIGKCICVDRCYQEHMFRFGKEHQTETASSLICP